MIRVRATLETTPSSPACSASIRASQPRTHAKERATDYCSSRVRACPAPIGARAVIAREHTHRRRADILPGTARREYPPSSKKTSAGTLTAPIDSSAARRCSCGGVHTSHELSAIARFTWFASAVIGAPLLASLARARTRHSPIKQAPKSHQIPAKIEIAHASDVHVRFNTNRPSLLYCHCEERSAEVIQLDRQSALRAPRYDISEKGKGDWCNRSDPLGRPPMNHRYIRRSRRESMPPCLLLTRSPAPA
jgi:hypothetical protein